MQKLFRLHLTPSERGELESLVRAKNVAKAKQLRAHILLLADEDRPGGAMRDFDIAAALCCGSATVGRTRKDLCEHGLPGVRTAARKPTNPADLKVRCV